MRPFASIPRRVLLRRYALVCLPLALLGFYASGVATLDETLFENERFLGTERNDAQMYRENKSNVSRALNHFAFTLRDWARPPEGCEENSVAGGYRGAQCAAFEARLGRRFFIVGYPLWFFLGGFFALMLWVKLFYQIASRNLQTLGRGKQEFARVTNPPLAPMEALAWLSGCHPVSVELASGQQTTAFVAGNLARPLAGERMLLFPLPFTTRRRGAVLFAPHMAIVAGE